MRLSDVHPVAWAVGIGMLLGGLVLARACRERDTPEGQRADSVLADTTRWLQQIQRQDRTIAQLADSIARTDRARQRWKDSAQVLLRHADTAQAVIDSTVAAGVPPAVEPARFWKDQYEAQRRVAAALRLQTIPALLQTIASDSLGIRQRDELADSLTRQRDQARQRAAIVTSALAELRQATRPGFQVLGMHLPGWVDNAAAGALGLGLGYAVGN